MHLASRRSVSQETFVSRFTFFRYEKRASMLIEFMTSEAKKQKTNPLAKNDPAVKRVQGMPILREQKRVLILS